MARTRADAPYQDMPDLSPAQYAQLKASIREHGFYYPVIVDENSAVIDGHQRMRVARELGIDAPVERREGLSDDEKRILAFRLNTERRQLSEYQKLVAARNILPVYEARARQRKKAGKPIPDNSGQVERGESKDLVAKAVGVGSGDTLATKLKQLASIEMHPDILARLQDGALTMTSATRLVERREADAVHGTARRHKRKPAEVRAIVRRRINRPPYADLPPEEVVSSLDRDEIEHAVLPYVERVAAWGDEIKAALHEPSVNGGADDAS